MEKSELLTWLQEKYRQWERLLDVVWVNDQRFPAGEFFDHFHDDHEPDVRAWLTRVE
jgi:hypothetical protein